MTRTKENLMKILYYLTHKQCACIFFVGNENSAACFGAVETNHEMTRCKISFHDSPALHDGTTVQTNEIQIGKLKLMLCPIGTRPALLVKLEK